MDKAYAGNEMICVAKLGIRLLKSDENEKSAKVYEGTLHGYSSSPRTDARRSVNRSSCSTQHARYPARIALVGIFFLNHLHQARIESQNLKSAK